MSSNSIESRPFSPESSPSTSPSASSTNPTQTQSPITFSNPRTPSTSTPRAPFRIVLRPKSAGLLPCWNASSPSTSHLSTDPTHPPVREVHHPTDLNSDADHLVKRSKSNKSVGAPERPVEKIKKSASEKSPVGSSEEKETTSLEEDEDVDVKADDFINRFKQQLRLQRLDSLLRYRNLLKRN